MRMKAWRHVAAATDAGGGATVSAIWPRTQVTDTLRAIVAQGADRLTVNFADVPRPDGTLLFAAEVLPHL